MKPWEETWIAAGRFQPIMIYVGEVDWGNYIGGFAPDMGKDTPAEAGARAKLAAEAPAMWRLLLTHEWCQSGCGDCENHPATWCDSCHADKENGHKPDCEWLRIAKAIGYRT